jgi:hypothetical protein
VKPLKIIGHQCPSQVHHVRMPAGIRKNYTYTEKMEIQLFALKGGLYASRNLCLDMVSSPLLIVATGASRISNFARIVSGHEYYAQGRRRLALDDLVIPDHRFSVKQYPGPYMGIPSDILTTWDVSRCQILCYKAFRIPRIALLEPKLFIFFLLKHQLCRIRSIVPVQFLSVVNFEQHQSFPSEYDPDDLCLLNHSSKGMRHFSFPGPREFDPDIAQRIREWAECPLCSRCGAVLIRGMAPRFCCNPFGDRI